MPNQDTDPQKIRAMLHADLDTPEETDELLPVVLHLRQWQAPTTPPPLTAALITQLSAALTAAPPPHTYRQRVAEWWPLLLIRSQVRVVGRGIWVASALVMTIGTLVTLATYETSGTVLLALLAPIVTAVGVALLYDSDMEQMLELENTTAATSQLLVLARLTLVFGFNLVLALAGSLLLTLVQTELSLWPLIMSWLAPMAFLSALAFLLSVLFVDTLLSTAISLGLWGSHVALRIMPVESNLLTTLLAFPGLNHPDNYLTLVCAAFMVFAVSLWLVGHEAWLSKDLV